MNIVKLAKRRCKLDAKPLAERKVDPGGVSRKQLPIIGQPAPD
jgi:hypothetical protein